MKRILSAIILIPLALLIVIFAKPVYYLIGIAITGTLCLYEYSRLMNAMKISTRAWFLYCIFWILLAAFYMNRIPATVILAITILAASISSLARTELSVRDRTFGLFAELFGILYIVLFLYPALPIRFEFGNDIGLQWTLLLLIVIWGGDTFALVAGKKMGRRPFAPALSPKKTKEGAAAGWIAGIVISVALKNILFPDLAMLHIVAVSALLGIFGQLGDLAESMLKRTAGIKDSSNLIPGHGGVLDRMDSLLFSIPVLYAYLLFLYH